MNTNGEGASSQTFNLRNDTVGICALVFSILSLFFMTIMFVPVSIVLSVIALVKKQYVWGICALIICFYAIYTSMSFYFLFAFIKIWKCFS